MSPRFAVLGSGSWGTVFAKVLADAGSEVTLWARRREVAEAIEQRRENPDYLPEGRLPDRLVSTSDRGWRWTGPSRLCSRCPARACGTTSSPGAA
jgi:glycerol-3-phosphate dehydrogenase (NAD(P)+)